MARRVTVVMWYRRKYYVAASQTLYRKMLVYYTGCGNLAARVNVLGFSWYQKTPYCMPDMLYGIS